MQVHKRTHLKSIDKPWICDVCGEGFVQKSNLRRHKLVRHEKRGKCPQCDMRFAAEDERFYLHLAEAHPEELAQHDHKMSLRVRQSNLRCGCNKGFKTLGELEQHQESGKCPGLDRDLVPGRRGDDKGLKTKAGATQSTSGASRSSVIEMDSRFSHGENRCSGPGSKSSSPVAVQIEFSDPLDQLQGGIACAHKDFASAGVSVKLPSHLQTLPTGRIVSSRALDRARAITSADMSSPRSGVNTRTYFPMRVIASPQGRNVIPLLSQPDRATVQRNYDTNANFSSAQDSHASSHGATRHLPTRTSQSQRTVDCTRNELFHGFGITPDHTLKGFDASVVASPTNHPSPHDVHLPTPAGHPQSKVHVSLSPNLVTRGTTSLDLPPLDGIILDPLFPLDNVFASMHMSNSAPATTLDSFGALPLTGDASTSYPSATRRQTIQNPLLSSRDENSCMSHTVCPEIGRLPSDTGTLRSTSSGELEDSSRESSKMHVAQSPSCSLSECRKTLRLDPLSLQLDLPLLNDSSRVPEFDS